MQHTPTDDRQPNQLRQPAHHVVGRENGGARLGGISWQRVPRYCHRAAARRAGFGQRLQAVPALGEGQGTAAAAAVGLRAGQGALPAVVRPPHLFQGGR